MSSVVTTALPRGPSTDSHRALGFCTQLTRSHQHRHLPRDLFRPRFASPGAVCVISGLGKDSVLLVQLLCHLWVFAWMLPSQRKWRPQTIDGATTRGILCYCLLLYFPPRCSSPHNTLGTHVTTYFSVLLFCHPSLPSTPQSLPPNPHPPALAS